jgi:hypothetical protein
MLLLLLLIAVAADGYAQPVGVITGRVVDQTSAGLRGGQSTW